MKRGTQFLDLGPKLVAGVFAIACSVCNFFWPLHMHTMPHIPHQCHLSWSILANIRSWIRHGCEAVLQSVAVCVG